MKYALSGRRVLLIGIGFYDYEYAIAEKIKSLGARVDLEMDAPRFGRTIVGGYLRRQLQNWKALTQRRHLRTILQRCKAPIYTDIVVIKGAELQPWFLRELRQLQPSAKFVLYQWDSIRKVPNFHEIRGYFDSVMSFDRLDCMADPTIVFRPLFFRQATTHFEDTPMYDFLLLGWLHSDRLEFAHSMATVCSQNNWRTCIALYTGWRTCLMSLFDGSHKYVTAQQCNAEMVVQRMSEARVIVDVADPRQSGLTIRTIETLGMAKKLLTTNSDVVNYDFFNPENIQVVQERRFSCDKQFVESPYIPLQPQIYSRYSLEGWLQEVLG